MALYAADGETCIHAANADPKTYYCCLDCRSAVRVRRAFRRSPHFYHIKKSPRCRLYSKSGGHLLLQEEIQALLGAERIQIERPFPSIRRIADLVWEQERIIFEIQCSAIDASEAQERIADYQTLGYTVVWLLDDRLFNQRGLRPAEAFLRTHACYFFSFDKSGKSRFYDQFEILFEKRRIERSFPLRVDFSRPQNSPQIQWPNNMPAQIQERVRRSPRSIYFSGDAIDKALASLQHTAASIALAKWYALEQQRRQENRFSSPCLKWIERYIIRPYLKGLLRLLKNAP